jgi:hypothetical protein
MGERILDETVGRAKHTLHIVPYKMGLGFGNWNWIVVAVAATVKLQHLDDHVHRRRQ